MSHSGETVRVPMFCICVCSRLRFRSRIKVWDARCKLGTFGKEIHHAVTAGIVMSNTWMPFEYNIELFSYFVCTYIIHCQNDMLSWFNIVLFCFTKYLFNVVWRTGTKPISNPHDGRRPFGLIGIRTYDHPHVSPELYHCVTGADYSTFYWRVLYYN